MRPFLQVLTLLSLAALGPPILADDWPQFRGSRGDGRSTETGLFTEWPASGPERLWEIDLGGGYSGVVAAEGLVYTQSSETGGEHLLAFEAMTGREIWRARIDRNRGDAQGGGPRATPAVGGGLVLGASAYGKLHAVDAATGEPRWSVDLVRDLDGNVPEWGYSSSPRIDGEVVYVETGAGSKGAVAALALATGEVLWRGGADRTGYSSPLRADIAGVPQVVNFGANAATGLGPATGRTYWQIPWTTQYDVNAAMPLFVEPDILVLSSGYGKGGMAVRLTFEDNVLSLEQLWTSRVLRSTFASFVSREGHLFGWDEETLRCLDAVTGREKWRQRREKGSLILAGDHLLVLGGGGKLSLAEASTEEWRELASAQVLRGRAWNAPALADGVFYARTADRLVALRVGGSPAGGGP